MKINKNITKIAIIMLLFILIGLIISSNVFAWEMNIDAYEDPTVANAGRAGNTVTSVMGAVINIASTIGAGIAIIMLIVLGIQYTSKGPEGKADVKKNMEGYLIGAVILFGVSGILKLLQMFIDGNLNNI